MFGKFASLVSRAKHYAYGIVLLVLGGGVLSWAGSFIREQELEQKLILPPAEIDSNDAFAQQLAVFSLGGMRSLAAEIATLDATDAWFKHDWPRCQRRWETATTLAPQRENYWRRAAFDMISNAAGDMETKRGLSPAERSQAVDKYIKTGERFLQKGLAVNPNSKALYLEQAVQYSNVFRKPKFRKAAEAYQNAMKAGADAVYAYMRFYCLCRARDAEAEAWALGRELIKDTEGGEPSLRTMLFVLQNKIAVPSQEALSLEQIYRPYANLRYGRPCSDSEMVYIAVREMHNMLTNDIMYPTHGLAAATKDAYLYMAKHYLTRNKLCFAEAAEALECAAELGATPHELTLGALLQASPTLPRSFTTPPTL